MVGVQLPNTVEIVVAFLAIVRIGAIVAPFPVQYRAWELTHLSNVAQVKAVHHGEPDRAAARSG